jgi:glycosyltransferase involved in cell wall biosynthesis
MISFIIPTLNEEKVLEKLLINLREVRDFEYEIIVSDGGSTDQTLEIAKQYANKVVENQPGHRQTIGEGRNMVAWAAKGEYLVFLDADVHIFGPDKFFKQAIGHFEKDPKLVGLGGWVRVLPEMETFADRICYGVLSNWSFSIHNNILKIGGNCGEFGVIKADIFRQLGGYNQNLKVSEDFELFKRLAKVGNVLTDSKLVFYHTGRRPHKVGWPKLLYTWIKDYIFVVLFGRSASDEWKVIR